MPTYIQWVRSTPLLRLINFRHFTQVRYALVSQVSTPSWHVPRPYSISNGFPGTAVPKSTAAETRELCTSRSSTLVTIPCSWPQPEPTVLAVGYEPTISQLRRWRTGLGCLGARCTRGAFAHAARVLKTQQERVHSPDRPAVPCQPQAHLSQSLNTSVSMGIHQALSPEGSLTGRYHRHHPD
jgi:hypothetical protein